MRMNGLWIRFIFRLSLDRSSSSPAMAFASSEQDLQAELLEHEMLPSSPFRLSTVTVRPQCLQIIIFYSLRLTVVRVRRIRNVYL